MSREFRRHKERFEAGEEEPRTDLQPRKQRTGVRQFTREVRGEMKRVNWPSRRELTSYSIVVLVAVSLVTAYIFGVDQAFGTFVFWIFG